MHLRGLRKQRGEVCLQTVSGHNEPSASLSFPNYTSVQDYLVPESTPTYALIHKSKTQTLTFQVKSYRARQKCIIYLKADRKYGFSKVAGGKGQEKVCIFISGLITSQKEDSPFSLTCQVSGSVNNTS